MIASRKMEAITTISINIDLTEELDRTDQYTVKAVGTKIELIMKKGKLMYVNYRRKGRHGRNTLQKTLRRTWRLQSWPN